MKSRSILYTLAAVVVAGFLALAGLRLIRPEVEVAAVKRGTAVSALPATVSVRADYSDAVSNPANSC